MYSKILVPIMGQYNEDLAEHTLELIDRYGVDVIALYVVDGKVPFLTPKNIKEAMVIELRKRGKQFLNDFENLLDLPEHESISLKKLLLEGKPAEEIIKIAKNECVDVIVLGTGKSLVDKHILGSVSDEVVHHAPCTIHLVRTIENKACQTEDS